MKLTTARLKQLIKEELSNVMTEAQGIEGLYAKRDKLKGDINVLHNSSDHESMNLLSLKSSELERVEAEIAAIPESERKEHDEFLARNNHMDVMAPGGPFERSFRR